MGGKDSHHDVNKNPRFTLGNRSEWLGYKSSTFCEKMKSIHILLLIFIPCALLSSEKEFLDYNFDGHEDYRIWRESNGRLGFYDIYIYSQEKNKYEKHSDLSKLFNPVPLQEKKEIECFWPGGHSSLIHYIEVYEWKENELKLKHVVRQTDIRINGEIHYVRVIARIDGEKPRIESIEHIGPIQK